MVMKQPTQILPILENRSPQCTEGGQAADGAQVHDQAAVAVICRPAIQPALEGQGADPPRKAHPCCLIFSYILGNHHY